MDTLTAHSAPVPTHETIQDPKLADMLGERERIMRELLPWDYEYAVGAGLLDRYDIDPNSGNDGLLHTLVGQTYTDRQGVVHAHGYHHEPSGEHVSPRFQTPEGGVQLATRVDRVHLAEGNSDHRKKYADRPLEPYAARVVVGGLHKMSAKRREDGSMELVPVSNSMFPKEYDALGVLQAVRIAHDGLDPINDKHVTDADGSELIINEGTAPLMDGTSSMRIRIVMRPGTRKIVTAIPLANKGIMKLTQEQAERLVWEQAR